MEKYLIYEFVGFEFANQLLLVKQAGFIESKRGVDPIIGNRPFYNIVIMSVVAVHAV